MQISRVNLEAASYLRRRGVFDYDPPEGWTYLGSGSSRTAYLGPDGLVYKLCRYPSDDLQSRQEAKVVWSWRKRKDLPEWCIIPRAYFDEGTKILVMEYFEGTQPPCWIAECSCGLDECWRLKIQTLSQKGWRDPQVANALLTPEGKVVLIDMGCNEA